MKNKQPINKCGVCGANTASQVYRNGVIVCIKCK